MPVVYQNVAGSWSHVNSETTDKDFCPKEMDPCLLLFTQPCTECNNTIIPYYIKLIWIPLIASARILPRSPPHTGPSADKGFLEGFIPWWMFSSTGPHWSLLQMQMTFISWIYAPNRHSAFFCESDAFFYISMRHRYRVKCNITNS